VLRHGQRADGLAADEAGQVLLLLRRAAIEHQLVYAQLAVRRVAESYAAGCP
jgi:hypothetical protein